MPYKDCIEIYYKQGSVECHRIYTWLKGCSKFSKAVEECKKHLLSCVPDAEVFYTDVRILWEIE